MTICISEVRDIQYCKPWLLKNFGAPLATKFTYKMRSGGKGMWGRGPALYKKCGEKTFLSCSAFLINTCRSNDSMEHPGHGKGAQHISQLVQHKYQFFLRWLVRDNIFKYPRQALHGQQTYIFILFSIVQ
jgi:hypothetical protein